jgi:hypothetical protein
MIRAAATALALAAVAGEAAAQAPPDSCAPKPFRWQESCRGLAGGAPKGLDRLRFLPLDPDAGVWLTLGGEYRFKLERLDEPDFGVRPIDQAYTAPGERFLLHADLRTQAGPRLYVELSAATDSGRKPFERTFDESAPDIAQAFVDIPLGPANVRVGRQELDLDQNRLVAVRDAANLRRAFDMAKLDVAAAGWSVSGFWGAPVQNRPDAFDDRPDPGERFYGITAHRPLSFAASPAALDVFLLERDRRRAIYQDGVGEERRRTLGARLAGAAHGFDYALQGAWQFGRFGSGRVRAWGVAGDFGYTRQGGWRPRLGFSFGVASGDARPHDGTLGTFDVLYPNLGYFTDAPLFYPGNTADVQPNLTLSPIRALTLRAGADVIWRLSRHDAIYAPPGLPLVPGDGTGSRHAVTLSYVRAGLKVSRRIELLAGAVHGAVGQPLQRAGGRDAAYGFLQATARF